MDDRLLNLLLLLMLYMATLLWAYFRNRRRRIGLFALGLYAASGCCSLIYFLFFGGKWLYSEVPLLLLIYTWAMSLVMMWPLLCFPDEGMQTIVPFNERRLCFWLWVFGGIVLCTNLVALPDLLANVKHAWDGNSVEIYSMRREGDMGKTSLSFGLGSACSVLAGMLSEIVVFFFFWAISNRTKRRLALLLGVCSLFPALMRFASAGRNGLVTFAMNVVFLWLLFRNFMSRSTKRLLLLSGAIVLSAMVLGIGVITLARFGSKGTSDAWESVFRYAGQPMLNMASLVPQANGVSWGDNTFPAVRMAFGFSHIVNRDAYRAVWENTLGIPMNIFYTIIGDFVLDYGWLGATLILVLGAWIVKTQLGLRNGGVDLSSLFLMYVVFLVAGHGMFYFTYKTFAGNLRFFAMVATYVALKMSCGSGRFMVRGRPFGRVNDG